MKFRNCCTHFLLSFLGCHYHFPVLTSVQFLNLILEELKIPLVKLLHKDIKWSWGDEQTEAFEKLKLALVSTPVLARPDFSLPFMVQTDASNMAIGAVLTQMHEDGEHPVVYISRALTAQEQNYSATEREYWLFYGR